MFNLPEKEANATQTVEEYIKLTTSFIGNFTAFQAYMDGFRAEGLHNAAHLVGQFQNTNRTSRKMTLNATSVEFGR
jgi:hypothetical protein